MTALNVRDLSMHYSERGDGPTVVAVHAATSNSVEIGWLAHAISKQGYTVVTPDLRGHGKTSNPAPDMHLPRLVEDMLEFTYLLGRNPIHGIGYSLGGGVCLYAAKQRPDTFKSLVLLGTTYHTRQERVHLALGGPLEEQPPMVQTVFDPVTGILNGWNAPVESFRGITCPVLIICADHDEFNGPQDSLELYRVLPNADLLAVPRCDHLGLVRNPHVLEAVGAFYERVRG